MLQRHELPIAEFDDDVTDLLSPLINGEWEGKRCPEVLVVSLVAPGTRRWLSTVDSELLASLETVTMAHDVHVVRHDGVEFAVLPAPLGGPAVAQLVDMAVQQGAKHVLTVGSCGALHPNEHGAFYVVDRALRDEGTSYHYLPPARWVDLDAEPQRMLREAVERAGAVWETASTWTTDAILRETPAMVEYRRSEGCDVVEMECASLAAVCRFRGASFGQLLYTADTLVDGVHDRRDWGASAKDAALQLCIDAAVATARD